MQQPFLPLAGGLPHPAFLEKPQKVKKKRKKRVIYPEEGKKITWVYTISSTIGLIVSSSTIDKIYEITLFTKIGTKSALFTKMGTKFS